MTTTSHLAITLVEQAQAQKEVTVNEALTRIDALLNTGAKSRTINTPPGSPTSGDLYIVGASPTGDWLGQAAKLAYFDQVWRFITPQEGVSLWVNDQDTTYTYDGTNWTATVDISQFQNVSLLGVNSTADSTNKLAVASEAVLFNHNGAGVQAKLNKSGSSDTASFLFQTGTSGRAEFGTVGDDNFSLKVSPDGSSWNTVLKMMAATGRLAFKSIGAGLSAAGSNQSTATALTSTLNQVTTVGSSQGVKLPSPEAGEMVLVANQGANALTVYPASGHSINNLAINTGLSVSTDTRRIFFAVSSSAWVSL